MGKKCFEPTQEQLNRFLNCHVPINNSVNELQDIITEFGIEMAKKRKQENDVINSIQVDESSMIDAYAYNQARLYIEDSVLGNFFFSFWTYV